MEACDTIPEIPVKTWEGQTVTVVEVVLVDISVDVVVY